MDPTSIPPRLSVGNSFNKMEKLNHQLSRSEFPADFSIKKTYEKRGIGKLSVGN